MQLRFFQIPCTISYAAGVGTVTVPRACRPGARAAIIGLAYEADDPEDALLNTITRFNVGARQHVQGDGVVLGLICPGAQPVNTSSADDWGAPAYFPASQRMDGAGEGIPLPGGGFAGGIPLIGSERIDIALAEVSAGNNAVARLTLLCVQFPDKGVDPKADAFWDRFAVKGVGAIHFHGSNITHSNGVVLRTTVEQEVHSPYQRKVRRLGLYGEKTTTTAVAEDNFADDSVQVYSSTEKKHQVTAVGARTVIGHAALWYPGAVEVDLHDGGKSLIDYSGPNPGADMVVRLAAIYQGMADDEPFLCGPDPF